MDVPWHSLPTTTSATKREGLLSLLEVILVCGKHVAIKFESIRRRRLLWVAHDYYYLGSMRSTPLSPTTGTDPFYSSKIL